MSGIKWLVCPACRYRFYIVEEQAGRGFEWFCPSCKHEFGDDESADRPKAPAGVTPDR